MNDVWLALGFFGFVMAAVLAAGFWLDGPVLSRWIHSIGTSVTGAVRNSNSVQRQLIAAGYRQAAALHTFYGLKCALSFGGAITGVFASVLSRGTAGSAPVAALGGAMLGYSLPAIVLKRRVRNRRHRIQRGLPAALDFCVLSLDAGQTLDQALMETSRGLEASWPDLSTELEQAVLETRAANDRSVGLRNFAERTEDPEVRKLISLLLESDRLGSSIVPALKGHAKYLRTRMRQKAQEAARKVAVKLIFPIFFLIFPSVLLITLGPACIMVVNQMHALLNAR